MASAYSHTRQTGGGVRWRWMLAVVAACILALVIGPRIFAGPNYTVETDKPEYGAFELVTITGSGYSPGQYLDIIVVRPDGTIVTGDGSDTPGYDSVYADKEGNFIYYYQLWSYAAGTYTVNVLDNATGDLLAQTTFIDGKVLDITLKYHDFGFGTPVDITLVETLHFSHIDPGADSFHGPITVVDGGTFTVDADAGGAESVGPKVTLEIDNGTSVVTIEVHTSCSTPIGVGFLYGDEDEDAEDPDDFAPAGSLTAGIEITALTTHDCGTLVEPTPTPSPTVTPTPTNTFTPTNTDTPTPTNTFTPTPTNTFTPTPTNTFTPTPTNTFTPTPTNTFTPTPTNTFTPTPTNTFTPTPTNTFTPTPTNTPPQESPTPTDSPTPSLTPTDTSTPTDTPIPSTPGGPPSMQKAPLLQNVFLTRQGDKVPPSECLSGTDTATLAEQLSAEVTSIDPKGDPQDLSAFEFELHYDATKVCVEISAGPEFVAAGAVCIIEDSATKPQLEGVARVGCGTVKKGHGIDELQPLANITIRPQPDVYSQAKPNQDNGVVVQINNVGCDAGDEQGHAIALASCDDADVTFRYLEGDVYPDCVVDAIDAQAIAFRWGSAKGGLVYRDFMNVEPSGTQSDDDIDINDLQFVYGRFNSTCDDPHPLQEPVNPKQ